MKLRRVTSWMRRKTPELKRATSPEKKERSLCVWKAAEVDKLEIAGRRGRKRPVDGKSERRMSGDGAAEVSRAR
jgi:hypothetical protein